MADPISVPAARDLPCPTCRVDAGARCRRPDGGYMRHPHIARRQAASAAYRAASRARHQTTQTSTQES